MHNASAAMVERSGTVRNTAVALHARSTNQELNFDHDIKFLKLLYKRTSQNHVSFAYQQYSDYTNKNSQSTMCTQFIHYHASSHPLRS